MNTSDLPIPTRAAILSAARDYRESAVRLDDTAALRQIDRLLDAVRGGARLSWQLGTLIVRSTSGNTYHVSRAACDCPHGRHGGMRCWHRMIFELLLDLFEAEVVTADMEEEQIPPPPPPPPIGTRLAAARSRMSA